MSFTWGDTKISANGDLTIADDDRVRELVGKLPDDTNAIGAYQFGDFMIAAIIEDGEAPILMVTENDDEETIREAYTQWRKLPRKFANLWRVTLNEAENGSSPK